MWKNSIEFFRISLFVPVVYKWLKSCAKKAHFPYPIEILFWIYAAVLFLIFFFWYLYRLWPIATSKTSSLTEWIHLRTILLYQRSFFIIPKVPSACIERFIRNNAPWILSRFSITSWCMEVNSWLIRTVRFLSVFLHFSAYGHPLQSSNDYCNIVLLPLHSVILE